MGFRLKGVGFRALAFHFRDPECRTEAQLIAQREDPAMRLWLLLLGVTGQAKLGRLSGFSGSGYLLGIRRRIVYWFFWGVM